MLNAQNQQTSSVSTSKRPIPLVARPDLIFERVGYQGKEQWVVKIPASLKYFRLRPEEYLLLKSLDGKNTIETLHDLFRREFPALVLHHTDIQRLAIDLYEKGLVFSDRPGQGVSLVAGKRKRRWKKVLSVVQNLLYLRLPGWDPYRTLEWLYRYFKWIFHPVFVSLAVAVVLAAWGLLLVQFDEFRTRLPEFQQFFGWPNVMFLWMTLVGTKVLHEFGHALSCRHYGGECHEIGVMLLVFSPTLYCDVSDSWMLRNKWQRIVIGAAGMIIEVFLSAIAIFIWWNTKPGYLNHLCLNVFFVTTITTVIFNANPLMRFDGYYMLADFLEIPNLRPKADAMLRDSFAWNCLGIESRPDPFMPETGRFWFITFAIAAWIYRWLVVFGIIIFLYTWLKPYDLQSIGATLAAFSLGTMIFGACYSVYRIVSAPRAEPMSRTKIAVTLTSVAVIGVAMLSVPIPIHYEAPFLIEPYNVKDVYTTVPGQLVETDVAYGQTVRQGQVLAKLSNIDMQEKLTELKTKERMQQAEVELHHADENWSAYELAVQKLAMLKQDVVEYEQQISHLTITSPADGVLVAPARRPKQASKRNETALGTWFGAPLDEMNRNAFLTESTAIAGIAPDENYQAVLLVDQADRRDLFVGQPVDFKLEHIPDLTFSGTVAEISKRELEFAPRVLSNKYGGVLPTVTDSQGREKISSGVAYQAKVVLDQETSLLLSGMRGHARFLVSSRTAADWLWQYCRRTFHFRL